MRISDWSSDVCSSDLQLRAMASLDPLMGKRGYPILFASGETANGEPLIDRQHPHDFLMEMSARLDFDLGGNASAFLYGGLPGEPAIGPAAFMRSEERRVVKGGVSTCRSRWSPYH